MSRRFSQLMRGFAGVLALLAASLYAQTLAPAVPAKGADAKTLLIYSGRHTPYSMADAVEIVKLQLRRVSTQVDEVAAADVDAASLTNADYLVIFCPQPFPALSETNLQVIAQRQGPTLWVGYGADVLQKIAPFEGKFQSATFSSDAPAQTITYQNREWSETLKLWVPTIVGTNEMTNVVMSLAAATNAAASALAWKTGPATFFAGLPTRTDNCALFSDLLLDYYGVTNVGPSAPALFIEGYNCRQNHEEFRNLVKYLFEHKHAFMVGVIPAYYDAVKQKVLDLDSQPEFVSALRFAQEHGGTLVMEGYLHAYKGRTGYEPEFWDAHSDRPLDNDSPEYVRHRVEKGLNQMFAKGLLPVAWQTPNYAASHADYTELAGIFSTAVERVQLSDATAKENFAGTACTVDGYGRLVIPENLGPMSPVRNPSPLLRIATRLNVLDQLRGTVALATFPAYLKDDKLAQVVTMLEQAKAPFLDLEAGDHWVQTSDALLLTGNAKRTVNLNNARIHWQAFDRQGHQIAEEFEPVTGTGSRLLERRGKGDYELFQFNQGKQ